MKKVKKREVVKKSNVSQWAIVIIIAIAAITILVISALNGNEKIHFSPGDCNVTGNGTEICNNIDDNCNNQTDEGLRIVCSNSFQCGNKDNSTGIRYCQNDRVYANVTNYTCAFPGTCFSKCVANTTSSRIQTCSSGCLNGNCIQNISNSCQDTDNGKVKSVLGKVSGYLNGNYYASQDVCLTNNTLKEYYCNLTQANFVSINCLSTEICLGGTCVAKKADSCSDTDGGYNPYTNGFAKGFLNGVSYYKTDFCNSNNNLTEYYCFKNKVVTTSTNCSGGCLNGACQQVVLNTCNDTDGGLIWNLKGTVSGKKNNVAYTKSDSCMGDKTLLEYYCSGGAYVMNQTYNCAITNSSKFCSAGACR